MLNTLAPHGTVWAIESHGDRCCHELGAGGAWTKNTDQASARIKDSYIKLNKWKACGETLRANAGTTDKKNRHLPWSSVVQTRWTGAAGNQRPETMSTGGNDVGGAAEETDNEDKDKRNRKTNV